MDESNMMKQIGQRIRDIRVSKKMTQNDLAFAAHISTSNVSDIELGKTRILLTTFVKIIEALQVSSDSILRTDVPEVNEMYRNEYSELLSDCTPAEIESIMEITKQVKATLHSKKNTEDY